MSPQRHQRRPPASRFVTVELPLLAVIALGTAGAVLVSDDLDVVRFLALGYLGVPLAVLYFGARALYPSWPKRLPNVARAAVVTLFALFLAGTLPLINAATTDGKVLKRTVRQGLGLATRDVKRGGLGWLFYVRKL